MKSSRSPSKEKATAESPRFSYRAFSDFGTPPTPIPRQTREDSDFWMGRYLAPGTPSPIRANQTPLVSPKRRMSFPIREPSLAIREKGTGFHDDKLAKSQGNYRHPSLRRGSGIAYQTPEVFGRFDLNRRRSQRGDIQPVEHRPLAVITKYPKQPQPQPQPEREPEREPPKVHSRAPTADFESEIWPAVQDKVQSLIEEKVSGQIEKMLQEREAELESLTRLPLLKADSSPEVYLAYVQLLQKRLKAMSKNSPMKRKTEAVMSLALDLEPGLETRLREHLAQIATGEVNQEENKDLEMNDREGQEEEEPGIDDEDVVTIPEEDDSDYQDDPDDVDEEDKILPSIERCTPVTTPAIMVQLHRYQERYMKLARSAKLEKKAHSRVLSPLDGHSNMLNGSSDDPQQTTGHLETSRKVIELEDTSKGKSGDVSNDKKRHLEPPSTPTRAGSKRRCIIKPSPGRTNSPASSASSYLPTLDEMYSSRLARQSSPATQPSTVNSQRSQAHRLTYSPAVREQEGTRDVSGAAPRPPVPLFGESPGLFMTPDPAPATNPFAFKRSTSRSVRNGDQIQHEGRSPSRFRENTADFEALDTPQKLLLLFKLTRGKK
ncbi:hypothetical protein HYE68_009877 [Fusarium pseudograminearum]|nr:hypothetical protein HYE68_009877 [Fusarium pseudograminearum]